LNALTNSMKDGPRIEKTE